MKTRPKKTVIGEADCLSCGRVVPVKKSETGTLDCSCQWCDWPNYAKAGTEAHANLMKRVRLRAEPDPDPTHPAPVENHAPPAEPKPAARAARSAFDFLGVSR